MLPFRALFRALTLHLLFGLVCAALWQRHVADASALTPLLM